MAIRVAINGFGRIGRNVLRAAKKAGATDIDFVAVNDLTDTRTLAHLLKYDSVHGIYEGSVEARETALVVDGDEVRVLSEKDPAALPWKDLGVDIVIESTGRFTNRADAAKHLDAGARKVIISAPAKKEDVTIVMGVNEGAYDAASHHVISNASCTTNCLAPVVKVIHESLGIKHGSITTIHDVTNTQTIVDRPAKDMRRARSALTNLIPTTTGSATAITLIYPELKGRLNGHAVRVPLLNASLTDCVFEVERATSAEEVNALFKAAAEGPLKGILGYETRPLVSCDFTNDPRSSIVDGPSTMVINGTQVKIYAWYDNEWGYSCRLGDIVRMVAGSM
jgi:glyceraldehyde 3-phosphate dehydrogenase